MTEKSKHITGLEKGEIIKSLNNYFTETEKRQTVEEYLNTDSSKIQVWRKHTEKYQECERFLKWMRKLKYEYLFNHNIENLQQAKDLL